MTVALEVKTSRELIPYLSADGRILSLQNLVNILPELEGMWFPLALVLNSKVGMDTMTSPTLREDEIFPACLRGT